MLSVLLLQVHLPVLLVPPELLVLPVLVLPALVLPRDVDYDVHLRSPLDPPS